MDKVPRLSNPRHKDVKAILFIYSMETFLYSRLNQIQRTKDTSSILTLGPFAVALTRIIDKAERNKPNLINGEFVCYRGISLTEQMLDDWCKKKVLSLDGYNSTSLDSTLAINFAFISAEKNKD